MRQMIDPTLIGTVQHVSGASITVGLNVETVTGVKFVSGESYRIGQIGSFVRIPIGFVNLYGIVSQVGAGAAPKIDGEQSIGGNRWLTVQLVGESGRSGNFQRGISQHPTIEDSVHIVTSGDLRSIYGSKQSSSYVSIGRLASSEGIPAYIDINKLVTRHSAIVGSTGCGKSTTVAGLLHGISNSEAFPSARIIIIDIHGEYQKAFGNLCNVFKIGANTSKGEKELQIPFWAMNFGELTKFAFGEIDDKKYALISSLLLKMKSDALDLFPKAGVTKETLTVDTPVPFCLHQLWLDLYTKDFMTIRPKPGVSSDEVDIAFATNTKGKALSGDAMRAIPPTFLTVKTTGTKEERIEWGKDSIGMRQQLEMLGVKLRDQRYSFICNPGEWTPQIDGKTNRDIDSLLYEWIGNSKPITILDLSGVPSGILNDIIGAALRVIYDAVFWGRNLPESGRERPILCLLEEAHTYLGKDNSSPASMIVKKIAKEGRKYGVGLMIVSQRPSEIDSTILSQCGTFVAMRLSNSIDRNHVTSAAADHLSGLFDVLPILRTGEAIVVGEAVTIPIRALITPPPPDKRPDSIDPVVVAYGSQATGFIGLGGWNQIKEPEQYNHMVMQWRQQSPNTSTLGENSTTKENEMSEWISTPDSSNLSGFSFEEKELTLIVEFKNGTRYAYYDVPESAFDEMKNAGSFGQYLNQNIKAKYRYSKL